MRTLPRMFGLAAFFFAVSLSTAADDGFTPLFNGKDMTGFSFRLNPKQRKDVKIDGVKPEDSFTVKDGVILVKGTPNCYMFIDKVMSDYVLKYDWRFPEGSKTDSNSGCMLHMQHPNTYPSWPRHVEAQGRYSDHGKLFFTYLQPEEILKQDFDVEKHAKASKPMGQWNTTEIDCGKDGTITVKLNGIQVTDGKTALKEGRIGWQCEGWEVHFKDIAIKKR